MRSFDRNSLLAWIARPMAIVAYPFYRAKYKLSHRGSRKDGISEMAEDPQWGKRGGGKEGPPDLDEILRKFNQKLGNLFGGKGGGTGNAGGGAGSGGPTAAMMGGGFALAASLVLFVWLASGFYIVEQGSKGVELRLGRYVQTTDAGPGPARAHCLQSGAIWRGAVIERRESSWWWGGASPAPPPAASTRARSGSPAWSRRSQTSAPRPE